VAHFSKFGSFFSSVAHFFPSVAHFSKFGAFFQTQRKNNGTVGFKQQAPKYSPTLFSDLKIGPDRFTRSVILTNLRSFSSNLRDIFQSRGH